MRLSCSTACFRHLPLRESFPIIRDSGCDAVEISWSQVQDEFAGADDLSAEVRALLRTNQLQLSGLVISDLASIRDSDWPEAIEEIGRQMAFARSLRLATVNLSAGDRKHQSLATLVMGLRLIGDMVGETGLTIELANREKSRLEQLDDLRSILFELRMPWLRVCLDTGQFHDASVNPRDVIREFGDRTGAVRISDRIGRQTVPLGQGEMNVPAIVEHLNDIRYDSWLVIGPDVPDANNVAHYLAESVSYLRGSLSQSAEGNGNAHDENL